MEEVGMIGLDIARNTFQAHGATADGGVVFRKKLAPGMAFRERELLVRQRTQTINALRGHRAEFGPIAPKGTVHLQRLRAVMIAPQADLPNEVIEIAQMFLDQIDGRLHRTKPRRVA